MKSLIMSVIFLGVAGYLGAILYQRAMDAQLLDAARSAVAARTAASADAAAPADAVIIGEVSTVDELFGGLDVYEYPALVELEGIDGQIMEVVLLRRSATHVQFMGESSNERFVSPLESLGEASRKLVNLYRVTGVKHGQEGVLEDLHLRGMLFKGASLKGKLRLLQLELAAVESNSQKQIVQNKIEALVLEMRQLDLELQTYKSQMN